jgi:hypothetical protein
MCNVEAQSHRVGGWPRGEHARGRVEKVGGLAVPSATPHTHYVLYVNALKSCGPTLHTCLP